MEAPRSFGQGLTKGGLAILVLILAIIAIPVGFNHSVRAIQPAAHPSVPDAAPIQILLQPGAQPPANMQDLRLQQLEEAQGILHWVWGMEIPTGKKLVIHLHRGDSAGKSLQPGDHTYEITGPLSASFGNRISLVRQLIDQDKAEQLSFEIRAQQPDNPALWKDINATIQATVDPSWEGDRGNSGYTQIPGTLWEQHLGPKSNPRQLQYQMDVAVAPADPSSTPGQIISR